VNLTELALERATLSKFLVFLLVFGGLVSYFGLGRLEDPDFTVKTAVVVTLYPGASPREVEEEVTNILEVAIQEMPQLHSLYSLSRAGMSIIKIDMKQNLTAELLPQVWDEMRKKIRDVRPFLPLTVLPPEILDDFSFVYGFVLAVTGDGYEYAELEKYAKDLKKELGRVKGVSRAELWGVQPKIVYVDVSEAQVAELGISTEMVLLALANQNMVVSSGHVNVPERRLRIEIQGEFDSPEDIGDVLIRQGLVDIAVNALRDVVGVENVPELINSSMIRIKDVADVHVGYLDPPFTMMRFNGKPALAVSIANVSGGNITVTGQNIDRRLAELKALLPAGIEVTKFQWQSDLVQEAIGAFIINLAEAVLIVVVILALTMGVRMGVVIGSGLILTILGTFIFMAALDIPLHRVSLGALVVALGMMVDNSIVVADGYAVRLAKGMSPRDAAIESATLPSMPLLGATIIAFMTFYPVYSAQADAGEYGRTLFVVVGISLTLSWVISITITPMQCISLIRAEASESDDPYGGTVFIAFRNMLHRLIRARALTLATATGLLVAAIWGFTTIPQQFFPNSTRAQFLIDYWAPEGTPIGKVANDLKAIEEKLISDPRTADVGSFIGAGGPRFYLPVDPEFPYQAYGQIVVNTPSFAEVDPLVEMMESWLNENVTEAMTRVRKYTVGPGDTWPFEMRIIGGAKADPATLRRLGEEAMLILRKSGMAKHIRLDMRQPVQKIVIDYSQERARWAAVSRFDMARATSRAYDGVPIGIYREGENIYPIVARSVSSERTRAAGSLETIQVRPALSVSSVALAEVADSIDLEWEDPIISRWNRSRQVAVQASPDGDTFQALRAKVIDDMNTIELPPGYRIEWDGEWDSTITSILSLLPGMTPTLIVILIIIVMLFNAIRPMIIMFLAIPFALIGISLVLGLTQTAFGFMALLGLMSLIGMMIKNSIVLLDEIDLNIAAGTDTYESVVQAAVSRLRPVALAALTTVLGVLPLLQDAFWVSMAMTIMSGLTAGTIVTMVLLPVLYSTVYRVPSPEKNPS